MPHHVHVTLTTADLASSVSIETSRKFPKLVEVCIPKDTRWTRKRVAHAGRGVEGRGGADATRRGHSAVVASASATSRYSGRPVDPGAARAFP